MIFIVYESPVNIINSAYTEFCSKYPKSCIYRLGSRADAQEITMLQHAPLLMPGWLIICSSGISSTQAKVLENCDAGNVLLIQCFSEMELSRACENLESVSYRVINNYRVDRDTVIQWVQEQTRCDYDSAKYLYNRLGGNMRDIVGNVSALQAMPEVDKTAIRRYTQKSPKAGVNDIIPFLLGVSKPGIQSRDIVKVLYKFQYAFSWLLGELRKQSSDYLAVFDAVSCGNLSLQNVTQYREISKNRRIRIMSLGKLKYIIQLFGQVSMEHLCFVQIQLYALASDSFSMAKLIFLLKIGG